VPMARAYNSKAMIETSHNSYWKLKALDS